MASPEHGNQLYRTRRLHDRDAVQGLYSCGCVLVSRTGDMLPRLCPGCTHTSMTAQWIAQEEAKAWNPEPGSKLYMGIDAAITSATNHPASVTSHPFGIRETSAFDWLDFQVEKVQRKAFAL